MNNLNEIREVGDKYFADVTLTAARYFATYFIDRGICVHYYCSGIGDYRTISFGKGTDNVDIMLAWIRRWNTGHEYCPFCGGVPEVRWNNHKHMFETASIHCTHCGATVGSEMEEDGAWKMWDRRTGEKG